MFPEYRYEATVTRVIDGDTVVADIDLGFYIIMRNVKLRLARIDAPEMRGIERADGAKSKAFLNEVVNKRNVIVQTTKVGSFGRYIAEVEVQYQGCRVNVSDLMVKEGMAEWYK